MFPPFSREALMGHQHGIKGQHPPPVDLSALSQPAGPEGHIPVNLNTMSHAIEPEGLLPTHFLDAPNPTSSTNPPPSDPTSSAYYTHSSAPRTNTDAFMLKTLRTEYPDKEITTAPLYFCNFLGYAATGHAIAMPITTPTDDSNIWTLPLPAAHRKDGVGLLNMVLYRRYLYAWSTYEFTLYIADGRDGLNSFPQVQNAYLIGPTPAAQRLLVAAGKWTNDLHGEIWVFDRGFWQKDAALYQSIQSSHWSDVILPTSLKDELISNVNRFFDSRAQYIALRVPWKRGIIFHGPPGNGKTISIKATMHMLYDREPDPIPTLYVKTLSAFAPPEYSLGAIFSKARQQAPCYLVFEDLDSIVRDNVRSFFLNEVDGLSNNDGILMVGSTNRLELLDPGISKRPSRFDRKFYFGLPDEEGRRRYVEYWQGKLEGSREVEFPDVLVGKIAGIMGRFSFAYMQEAFVASLLVIAGGGEEGGGKEGGMDGGLKCKGGEDGKSKSGEWEVVERVERMAIKAGKEEGDKRADLDKYVLWREIKKQVATLRKELEGGNE